MFTKEHHMLDRSDLAWGKDDVKAASSQGAVKGIKGVFQVS